jgi:Mrp family chromosome partitioning ATPase
MSALDQAITKAYAKDRPAAKPQAADAQAPSATVKTDGGARQRAVAVEQLYRDGTLYRVEHSTAVSTSARIVPRPHVASLPPTSPRRNVRRSVLRLLAAESQTAAAEQSPPTPPRIARKVIIRHVSHSTAPAPLGLRTAEVERQAPASPVDLAALRPKAELPPEKLNEDLDPPPTTITSPPASQPAVAPLNARWEAAPAINVHGHWLHEASIAPLLMYTDASAAKRHPAFAECVVHVDAIAAAHVEAAALAADRWRSETKAAAVAPPFQTKSLDELEAPKPKIYIDSAHSAAPPRAHARFAVEVEKRQVESDVRDDKTSAAWEGEAPAEPPTETITNIVAATEAAVIAEEPLASDLIPATPVEPIQPEPSIAEPVPEPEAERRTAIPVWEVDRFQWPRTCEKLVADDSGYLATAGDKLLAAVQDGLKVLAITGTRRGEGRTTMALCLARMAAKAGVQVAIMDADFARPQIASKLGLETAHGWQDAALGKIPLSEAAVKSLADDITVLPLESSSVVKRLSLADPRVTATIRAVAATFELVVLDLGPIQAGEQLAFPRDEASPLDAAIVVRDVRFATTAEGETIGHMLQDLGVEAVGIAENFVIDEEIPATSV